MLENDPWGGGEERDTDGILSLQNVHDTMLLIDNDNNLLIPLRHTLCSKSNINTFFLYCHLRGSLYLCDKKRGGDRKRGLIIIQLDDNSVVCYYE
jgi:hypothetical protein